MLYWNGIPFFLTRRHRNGIPFLMAKLSDIQKWLERSLGGDAPRANSLIKTVRQSGMFTTSGKGRHAPQMVNTDYATAICTALVTDPPTAAPSTIAQLLSANFIYMEVTRADGGDPVLYDDTIQWSDKDEYGNRILPKFFVDVPKTVSAALCRIADEYRKSGRDSVAFHDCVKLSVDGDAWVDIHLNGLDFGTVDEGAGWTENKRQTEYNWRFRYHTRRHDKTRSGRAIMVRLDSQALYGLADLAHASEVACGEVE
jgi:hypothetical protein